MILDQIVLHNFGVYGGRHVIDLTPPSKNRPVILFGALNGSGKTTLLDAFQLVLYGKHADCSNRGELAYDEFLRRSIHRTGDSRDSAALELQFRHRTKGVEHTYRVHRSWVARERSVRERVEVLCDDVINEAITESWAERVEEFIPVRLSKFFFFDGEKIEALANLEQSADVLSTAIQSLLGLDLVDQLSVDLKVIERRSREKQRPEKERVALEEAKAEVDRLESLSDKARDDRASRSNEVELKKKLVRELEEKFRKSGGQAFARRAQVEGDRARVRQRLAAVDEQLLDLAGKQAPLLLVMNLLDTVANATAEQRNDRETRALAPILESRDTRVLNVARDAGAQKNVLTALEAFLSRDRESMQRREAAPSLIHLSSDGSVELGALRSRTLPEAQTVSKLLLQERRKLQNELDRLDQTLASTPEKDAIGAIASELDSARQTLARAEAALHVADEQAKRLEQERAQKWSAYAKRESEDVDEHFREQEAERLVTHSEAIRSILVKFRSTVVEKHVRRIEELIVEGLRHLLRKASLVSSLTIDPLTYRMTLYGDDRLPLSPERLSAGERQLLAISTIWALARAAGRPLPVVIDTPLGRLDSVHRNHLVERYFPMASHQVLLLSTDEEIDAAQLEKLKPSIGRSYRLTFDDQLRSTRVESGYFW